MYDFYPEWGPARHREDDTSSAVRRPRYWQPAARPEAWDSGADQPDDN
jgi:hypothetical protein